MKTTFKILISAVSFAVMAVFSGSASDYVAVGKNGNVYDEANAKYITANQDNDDVSVIPGMVFLTSGHTPGWYKVEYSPGLHAFLPEAIVATDFSQVSPGTYEISNKPGTQMKVDNSGDEWTATVNGKTYKGTKTQEYVIFTDDSNNVAFSLVDLGNGPIAITYDNSVTKFF